MLKLYNSPSSPFVRKVRMTAHELGLFDQIELIPCKVNAINRDQEVVAQNPLGQVPTMILPDGTAIYDSRVICEYLDLQVPGSQFFPKTLAPRLRALSDQAAADGLLAAATLGRTEVTTRPKEKYWDGWVNAQMAKISSVLDNFEAGAAGWPGRVDIGTVAAASGLSYLDFRYTDFDWRKDRKNLAAWYEGFCMRPSFQATLLKQAA